MIEAPETRSYKIEITGQQITRLRTTHDFMSFIKIQSFSENPRIETKICKCSESPRFSEIPSQNPKRHLQSKISSQNLKNHLKSEIFSQNPKPL